MQTLSFRIKLGVAFCGVLLLAVVVGAIGWLGMEAALERQSQVLSFRAELLDLSQQVTREEQSFAMSHSITHSRTVTSLLRHIEGRIQQEFADSHELSETERDVLKALESYSQAFSVYVQHDIDLRTMESRMLSEANQLLVNATQLEELGVETSEIRKRANAAISAQKDYLLWHRAEDVIKVRDNMQKVIELSDQLQSRNAYNSVKLKLFRISNAGKVYAGVFDRFVQADLLQTNDMPSLRRDLELFQTRLKAYIQGETLVAEKSLNELKLLTVVVSVLVICIGVAATMVLARVITRPINELRASAEKIVNGDLDSRVAVRTQDEIGELGGIFNQMSERLKASFADLESKNIELQKSENRYKVLFETNQDALMTVTPHGLILSGNKAALEVFGCESMDDFVGKQVPDFLPELMETGWNASELVKSVYSRVEKDGSAYIEATHVKHSGELFPAGVLITRIELEGQVQYLATVRDITQRRQNEKELAQYREHLEELVTERTRELEDANEQLRQAEKMQAVGQLAGGIAHDFNNQLGGIVSCAEILSRKLGVVDDHLKDLADRIVATGVRAGDLISQLLAFARKGKYLSMPVDVHVVVNDMVTLLRHTVDRRIEIEQRLCANPPTTTGDASQIQNAFLNIALNACDAMSEGGSLVISSEIVVLGEKLPFAWPDKLKPGDYVLVTFADTGKGIESDVVPRVFEPFFTTKEVGQGTGMGLSAVYGAMRNHHGAVAIESEVGKGTKVRLWFPLLRGAETEVESTGESVPAQGRYHLLLVDDEEIIRITTSEILEDLGYRVSVCCDGKEAVEFYKQHSDAVDLVLLDLVMPRKDGLETFREMRLVNPEVKVVICSGYSRTGKAQSIIDAGALAFLQKPFQQGELSRVIAENLT